MSNLIKRPEQILTVSEINLLEALSSPMLKDMSPTLKDAANVTLIANVYANVNEKNTEPAVESKMLSDLRELMDTEFKAMRVSEIKIALDWGSDNWTGHGVSSKLIKGWIREWRQTEKLRIQKQISIKRKNQPEPPRKEMSKPERLRCVQNEFERHVKGGLVVVNTYNHLIQLGIEVDLKTKQEAVLIAVKTLKESTRENVNQMIVTYVKARLKELEECDLDNPIPIVITQAQRLIVTDIFNDYQMNEVEPKDVIKI